MRKLCLCVALACAFATGAIAQQVEYVDVDRTIAIDTARGVDPGVDYPSLVAFGPWDDRNYQLTRADLALLAPNESELHTPIPAFFRVLFRRTHPETPREGPVQYPRSAFNVFRQQYDGYLADGLLYTGVTFTGGRFYIDKQDGVAPGADDGVDFVSGEVRVTSPVGAAESAIKINPVDTNLVIAGSNGPSGGQRMHFSTDGGETWTQTELPGGGTCCDPAVDWSSDGQTAYTTALGNCVFSCGVWFYRSDDGGQTWGPRVVIASSGGDKEYLHVDKSPASPFRDNLYVTWHASNVLQFARSTNQGSTWSTQAFSSLSEDRGIGSDIATDHNGVVYYIWPAFNSRTIRLRRSNDGGASFGATTVIANTNDGYDFAIPAMESRRAFIYVAADADLSGGAYHGSVYAAWTDTTGPESGTPANNHARIQVAYSRDGGNSWTTTTPHETADQLTVDRFHPWLGVGPDGTVYVAYYDTREGGTRTSVDFYYSTSTDGGQTWSAPEDLTTVTSPNIADGFEWGDYNGLDVVMNDLITIFTDNRSEGGGSGDSVDVYAAGLVAGTPAICGNDTTEPGEACDGTDLGGQTCVDFGCSGGTLACDGDCGGFDTSACTDCVTCNNDGVCNGVEDCTNCPNDCISGSSNGAQCGNGLCEAANGENCLNCAADCAGQQGGKPSGRYCCGDGGGTNPVPCSNPVCTEVGFQCTENPTVPSTYCCGDGACNGDENCGNCATDCTTSATEICNNGSDDDCANGADCSDPTCASDPSCQTPTCLDSGAACTNNSECCSDRCKGRGGAKTCQ